MSDAIDMAQELEAINISDAIERQMFNHSTTKRLTPTGECRNQRCGEPFDGADSNRIFCGPGCAAEYEHLRKMAEQLPREVLDI